MAPKQPVLVLLLVAAAALPRCCAQSSAPSGSNGSLPTAPPAPGLALAQLADLLLAKDPSPNQTREAFCASNSIQVLLDVARIPFRIHEQLMFCPESHVKLDPVHLPLMCMASTGALIAVLSDLAGFISLIAADCNRPTNHQALCAAPIAATIKPMGLLLTAAGMMGVACSEWGMQLEGKPLTGDLPQWEVAECPVEALNLGNALLGTGLVLNNLITDCYNSRLMSQTSNGDLYNASCALDVSGLFQALTAVVTLSALSVQQCEATKSRPGALCLAGIGVLLNALATATSVGAGMYVACNTTGDRSQEGISSSYLPMGTGMLSPMGVMDPIGPPGVSRRLLDELAGHPTPPHGSRDWQMPQEVQDILAWPGDSSDECFEEGVTRGLYDLYGHPMSVEESAAACQARCARVESCAFFSYWGPGRHCHLHDALAPRQAGRPHWTSGTSTCVPQATQCLEAHAQYEAELAASKDIRSARQCQLLCQKTPSCAHFTFSLMSGACTLAFEGARRLHPVLFHVSGPPACPVYPQSMWAMWWNLAFALGLCICSFVSLCALFVRAWVSSNVAQRQRTLACDIDSELAPVCQ